MDFGTALRQLWPKGNSRIPGLLDGIIRAAPATFAKYNITSQTVLAHIMAQISHECGAGTEVVENLNYSAERMCQVWPNRFPNVASARPFEHNPRALANKVYNGRMGNRPGTEDGYNYRGRGATQTTGREGYQRLGQAMGVDFINNPDAVNDPALFLECGIQDFILCGCMPYAVSDNITMVTKRLNGGTVGLDERVKWFARWNALNVQVPKSLPVDLPPIIPADPKPKPANKPSLLNVILSIIKAVFSWKR